jgi:ABC-type glycerol-3-phosphate transport system substrate-binding protein
VTQWDGDTLTRAGMALFANEFSLYEDLRLQLAGAVDGNFFPTKDSASYADEVGVQAWQRIMDIYDVHQLDSKLEGIISRDRFGAGNAVTMYQWTWFNGFMETQYPDVQWGIKVPPTISGEPVYGRRGPPDVGFTVTTQNENNLEAAFTFYRYLVSPAYLARYCRLRGIQPSLRSMWEDANFSADAGERWGAAAVKNRPENSVDFGFWPLELVNITNNITPSIRDEGMDITTVLKTAEDAANCQWSIVNCESGMSHPRSFAIHNSQFTIHTYVH